MLPDRCALGRRAAAKRGTLRVYCFWQPGVCLGDVPLAIGLTRDAASPFGLVHGGVADARRRAASRVEDVS